MWLKSSFYALVCVATLVSAILATFLYGAQERDSLLLRAALAGEAFALMESQRSQEYDSDVAALDWSIRKECEELLDVLFLVFSHRSDWSNRADIRDTLLEERVKTTFRWAGAFVLTGAEEPLVAKWIEVEGHVAGDLIALQSARGRSSRAFRAAVRWTLDNCPGVRFVIKMNDDTTVHPLRLYNFLNGVNANDMKAVHCDMRDSFTPRKSADVMLTAAHVPFFAVAYRRHCAGSVVLTSLELLRSLANFRPFDSIETASVSGLVHNQTTSTSYVVRNASIGWFSNISLVSKSNFMFVKLEDTPMRRLDRYALWYFALWKHAVWKEPRFRMLLTGVESANRLI
ncbi:hypothetical protein MRX96_045929 [Rhipicephalus microplus]